VHWLLGNPCGEGGDLKGGGANRITEAREFGNLNGYVGLAWGGDGVREVRGNHTPDPLGNGKVGNPISFIHSRIVGSGGVGKLLSKLAEVLVRNAHRNVLDSGASALIGAIDLARIEINEFRREELKILT